MKIRVTKTRDVLTPSLTARLQRAREPRKALEAMGLAVVSLTQRAFTQASLRPSAWPPLKPATIKAKIRMGYGTKPLRSSGTLARSPRVVSVTSREAVVGSDRKAGSESLAAIHQLGTRDGRIPARPTWPFDRDGKATARGRRNVEAAAVTMLDLEYP